MIYAVLGSQRGRVADIFGLLDRRMSKIFSLLL